MGGGIGAITQVRSLAARRRNILKFGCSVHFSAFAVTSSSLSESEIGIYRSTMRAGRERWLTLAADGAIACFSSNSFSFSLNAVRAPQLKPSVRCLLTSQLWNLTFGSYR